MGRLTLHEVGEIHDPKLAVTFARENAPSPPCRWLWRHDMLQLAAHYTSSPSTLAPALLLLAIGLAGVFCTLYLGCAVTDSL